MKYFIRSLKYFLYFAVLFSLIVLIIFYTSDRPEGVTVADLFKEGSGYKILAFFIAVSAIYPLFGFAKKEAYLPGGNAEEKKREIIMLFENANFELTGETAGQLTFRPRNKIVRLIRMCEDAVTVNCSGNPVVVSGLRKDVFRFARLIEYTLREQ